MISAHLTIFNKGILANSKAVTTGNNTIVPLNERCKRHIKLKNDFR